MSELVSFGGCHLTDYIVGPGCSFIDLFVNQHSSHARGFTLAPTNFRRIIDLLSRDDSFIVTDDSVCIIQVGNYETGVSIWPFSKANNTAGSFFERPRDGEFEPNIIKDFVVALGKLSLLLSYDLLGKSRFDEKKFSNDFSLVCSLLLKKNFRRVIVISSFRSRQPHLNIYRKRANSIMKSHADKFGFYWFDAYGALGGDFFDFLPGPVEFFYDKEHLSKLGHEHLASKFSIFFDGLE